MKPQKKPQTKAQKQKSRRANRSPWGVGGPILLGLFTLFILIGGLGIWGTQTELAGAVVATGRLEVRGNRQIVQHPDGGVVTELLVQDGDEVSAGEVLIRLDSTFIVSELAIVDNQLHELMARRARLIAERDGATSVVVSGELLDLMERDEEIRTIVEGQKRLFDIRHQTLEDEQQMLTESIKQTHNQVLGFSAQLKALETQSELIKDEINDQRTLKRKGLSRESQLKSLQREASRLAGETGHLTSEIARMFNQITSTKVEILRLERTRRQEAITELRDNESRIAELQEKRLSLREQLVRLEIRAPVSGVVYDSRIFAVGSVVQPADPIMFIIPESEPLVITVNVPSFHVDQVYNSQPVSLRFSAFSERTTPVIFGKVMNISADAFSDEKSGATFYRVQIRPDPGQIERLQGKELVPGMPVEAFIQTSKRTPLSYLTKPMTDYFARAFRE